MKSDKEWMEWILDLHRVDEVAALPHPAQEHWLEQFKAFFSETAQPRRGKLAQLIFRYKGPPATPTLSQLERFQAEVQAALRSTVEPWRKQTEYATAAGASPSIIYFSATEASYILTSGNPLDSAITRLLGLIKAFRRHLKQCPQWQHPRCEKKIFLATKESQEYCSRTCYMRVFMRSYPKPKKGAKRHGTQTRRR